MNSTKSFVLLVSTFLNVASICCKDAQTNSPENQVKEEITVDSANIPVFAFILYDGLPVQATASIRTKLHGNALRIMTDLQVEKVDTYTVHLWGVNDSYLIAQQQHIGRSFPGSTGYVMGSTAMGLLNVSGVADNAVHEYVHSMSLLVNRSFGNNPRWYWEAIALFESGGFVDPKNISYLVAGNYPTLSELNSDFNNGAQKIYQVGYLLAEFIKVQWGMKPAIDLIKENGNIQKVFGKTNTEFEAQWKQFIEATYFMR